MIFSVTGQGAHAVQFSARSVLELTIGGRRHVVAIEIDQVRRIRDAVRIMAGRAGGFVVDDVFRMVLEALVGENA